MKKTIAPAAILVIGLAAVGLASPAEAGYDAHCVATAGLDKHTPATTTTGTERTGSYDVTVSTSARGAELKVEPKKPVEAGAATKVAAPIDKVLLRSPFKSEATALPTRESSETSGTHVATFDLDAIRALPNGDVNVVIVTPDGERVCRISRSERQKLVAR